MIKNRSLRVLQCVLIAMLLLATVMFMPACQPQTAESAPDTPAVTADEYNKLRTKWQTALVGDPTYDTNDPDIAAKITSTTKGASSAWSSLIKEPTRKALWSDLSQWPTKSSDITGSYNRLKNMAIAFNTKGSSLYGNTALAADIMSALDWMHQNVYNETISKEYDNWWDWEIGSPQALNDIAVLMYDSLSASQKANYINAVDHFVPDPTIKTQNHTTVETGANRADKALVVMIRGILDKTGEKLAQGRDALSQIFPYVTSGDGFYADGSFIQHSNVPYTVGYGQVLLIDMARILELLSGSSWDVKDPNVENIYSWVIDSYQPIIYKGAAMDMVAGRKISRQAEPDHTSGRSIITTIARLAQFAPSTQASAFKSIVKAWVQQDRTFTNYYTGMTINELLQLKAIMKDDTISPSNELIKNQVFSNMDRVIHLRPGFAFGLSLFSDRISAFESGNGENLQGWWTGLGMTYLYNNDLAQYSSNFWPTVNMYRLPGTTTDGTGSGTPTAWKLYPNTSNWVGGSSLNGLYGIAGMDFSLTKVTGSSLQGKKSWFLFGDSIVALGADITSKDDSSVETIVEIRKLNAKGDNLLTVNGVAKPIEHGWSEEMSRVQWAHLVGSVPGSDIGYYFPEGANVHALRESRTGAWKNVNNGGSTTPVSNYFLSLALEHGVKPANATYSYVLLPNKDAAATADYASHPDMAILENSSEAQAVKNTSLNAVGVNFWSDASKTLRDNGASLITSDKKSSVTMLETPDEIDLAVSDPTQSNTGAINLEIYRSSSEGLSLDPAISVTQYSPTIKLTVNVSGSLGKTFTAKIKKATETN
ncbi:polysaccharide lyase 8 family protein [Paenibacillus cremeus]|uniref:Polysaccharide lyase 8 family protein n=1 Tax=Paenibacillus cremeus TaxID=2163881 RepID=A0A559KGD8_9BACL|nr:polysaccharide lyase 8 family protein [Paenibacillus cremeus]TVY11193.1 polysaccharide lyase 8 family protein [Paenibacillus cremeus]